MKTKSSEVFDFTVAIAKRHLMAKDNPCRLCPHVVVVVRLWRFSDLWGYAEEPIWEDEVSTMGGARYRATVCHVHGNRSNEIPCTWHQRQQKERAGFLVSRSLTLSSARLWAGGVI